MCRNIKTLFNFQPPATEQEIHAAALQFVRKVSGCNKPSNANQMVFDTAVRKIERNVQNLLDSLVTSSQPKNRVEEAATARKRAVRRFARAST